MTYKKGDNRFVREELLREAGFDEKTIATGIEIISAPEKTKIINQKKSNPSDPSCLIVDKFQNFSGIEATFVIGVGLDSMIDVEDNESIDAIRSRIYKVMTRANMTLCFVDVFVENGFFHWLITVVRDDKKKKKMIENLQPVQNDEKIKKKSSSSSVSSSSSRRSYVNNDISNESRPYINLILNFF